MFDRVIETGMVATYARPYIQSSEAGLGKKWWPKGEEDRKLHDQLVELRSEYHVHADHTAERRLENLGILYEDESRPRWTESWSRLPNWKLREVEALSTRQAALFEAEAARLDLELFGPTAIPTPGSPAEEGRPDATV